MTDGGQDFDLGQVVGSAGEKGDDGSTVWNTSTAPTYANSKYTFNISNLSGKTGLQIAVNDIIFYSTYYYIVSAVNTTTVDCTTRVSIKGSDASVTIVDNLNSTSSTSALSAKQGKVLNDNKIETSAIVTSFGSTPSDSKVASEKLVKNSLDGKQATLVSGTNIKTINNNSLLGSGNIDIQGSSVDIVTSWETTPSDSKVASEKLTKDTLDTKANASSLSAVATSGSYADLSNKPTIPSKISDLQNDSDFIETSSTAGLIKNDGTIDTNAYITNSALTNYVQKSSTSGLIKNDGSIDTTSYSTFSGSYSDLTNKPSIPSASSDLSDGSSLVKKSSTSGLIKNDGTIDTTVYSTFSGDYDDLTDKPTIPSKISDLTNDSDFIETSSTTGLVKNDGTIDTTQYLSSLPSHNHDDRYYTESEIDDALDDKLDTYLTSTFIDGSDASQSFVVSDNATGEISRTKKMIGTMIIDLNAHSNIGSSANAHQGNINNLIDSALGNKISKSNTSGLVKNDGSIDTNSYLTSSALANYVQKSSTTGLIKNDGTIMTGGTGSSNYAIGNHTHGLLNADGEIDATNSYSGTTFKLIGYKSDATSKKICALTNVYGRYVVDNTAHSNIGSSVGSHQETINGLIDTALGSKLTATKVTSWSSTVSDSNVPSEKLVKDYVDGLVGSAIQYIVGSGS